MDHTESFLTAVKANESAIYKIAGVFTNTNEDRNDLVQEIIYQLWKSFGTFNRQSSISTWMYRIAMNVAIYQLKKERRRPATMELDDAVFNFRDQQNSEEDAQWNLLKQHIDQLNLLEKGIVVLYLEEKSYEEIAEVIGISVSNVGTRLSRIKEKIRQQIFKQS